MVASLLAAPSIAQPPGGGGRGQGGGGMRMFGMGGGMGGGGGALELLRMEEVRSELKLDESQVKDLTSLGEELRDESSKLRPDMAGLNFRDMSDEERQDFQKKMEESGKKIAEISKGFEAKAFDLLDPDQQSRLMGLVIQRNGSRSLSNEHVAGALGLDDSQKAKLVDIDKAFTQEMRDNGAGFGRGGGGGNGGPPDFEAIRAKMEEMNKKFDEQRLAVLTDDQKAKMESMKGSKFEFPARGGFGGGPGQGGGGGGGRGRGGNGGGGRPGGAGRPGGN